jgi:hypothetical protein
MRSHDRVVAEIQNFYAIIAGQDVANLIATVGGMSRAYENDGKRQCGKNLDHGYRTGADYLLHSH